jgi:DNA polymerase-1
MKVIAFDIETVFGQNKAWEPNFYLTCIGAIRSDGERTVWWFEHSDLDDEIQGWQDKFNEFQAWIDWADVVVAHNLKYDMTVMRCFGLDFEKVKLHCTCVTEYLIQGQDPKVSYKLTDVAQSYGLEPKLDKVATYWARGKETRDIPKHLIHEYVLDDCEKAYDIYIGQQEKIAGLQIEKLVALQNEFQMSLSDMEKNGFNFDIKRAMDIRNEALARVVEIEEQMFEFHGEEHFNMGSDTQLKVFLYGGTLKMSYEEWTIRECKTRPWSYYSPLKREKTIENFKGMGFVLPKNAEGYTDKDTLTRLVCKSKKQKAIKKLLLEYSHVNRVANTLLNRKETKGLLTKIMPDGFIHPSLNMTVTATGRLSSSDPNSQNMPRGNTSPIKTCIIPRFDKILQIDLSQIEWRGAAELSQDQEMIHEVNNGIDQHGAACVDLMELELTKENRFDAKVFNFRMIYGGTAYGYYMDSKMPNFSLKKWSRTVKNFFAKYFGLKAWQDKNVQHVLYEGTLQLFTGRWFKFHKSKYVDEIITYNDRQIKNYPVQGLAGGDILPLACVIIRRALQERGLKSLMILTVHDSIVFDAHENEIEELKELTLTVVRNLPAYIKAYWGYDWGTNLDGEVEIGPNYGEMKEVV